MNGAEDRSETAEVSGASAKPAPTRPMDLAGSFRFAAAVFVDLLVFLAIAVPIWAVYPGSSDTAPVMMLASMAVVLLVYTTLCLGRSGQTLGMRYTCIRMMHGDGSPIGYANASLRSLLRSLVFSFVNLAVFMVMFEWEPGWADEPDEVPAWVHGIVYAIVLKAFHVEKRKDDEPPRDDEVVIVIKRPAEDA